MITLAQLRTADPRDLVDPLSYALPALIRTARLALESHPGNEEAAVSVALVLELAEGLSHALGDGIETMQREDCATPEASA